MSLKLLALAGVALADPSINVTEDQAGSGATYAKTVYVAGSSWAPPVASATGFSLPHSGRAYLATKNECGRFSPDMYYAPNLLGGSIEYDFDLSQASCGCNAALYLISMPGYNKDGNALPSTGKDYYCDANKVGGVWCPEMDIMEANQYAWHLTPHRCDAPDGKSYPSCDTSGCGKSIHHMDGNAYGPGSQYRIDTTKRFHAKIDFNEATKDTLTSIVLTLTQDTDLFTMTIADEDCAAGYLSDMTKPIKDGMTMAISNWGDVGTDMSWLDGDTGCKENCGGDPTVYVTNIVYKTVNPTGPTPV